MLYDPKWEVEVKADPFSLGSLIAWLEKQPTGKSYRYTCNGHCLLAQYFTALGFENVTMWTDGFWHGPAKCPGNVGQDEAIASKRITLFPPLFNQVAQCEPFTFGAALNRARKAEMSRT